MSGIQRITVNWSVEPAIVSIYTLDDYAVVAATGYILTQAANIQACNNGSFDWAIDHNGNCTSIVLVYYATGQLGWFTYVPTTGSLVPLSGSASFVSTTSVSNTALLGMYATPVELVAPAGAGTLIDPQEMIIDYAWSTADTAAGGAITAQFGNAAHAAGVACTTSIAAATLNGLGANAILKATAANYAAVDTSLYNTGIYLSNASAAFTTGSGSATVYLKYNLWIPA